MNNITLRLNEIRFRNAVMHIIKQSDITKLKDQLNSILKLIDHPNPIAISTAWMEVLSMNLDATKEEHMLLLYLRGDSKYSIRAKFGTSPNKVYTVVQQYESDPYEIKPKLDKSTSESVTIFIERLEEYLSLWKGDTNEY